MAKIPALQNTLIKIGQGVLHASALLGIIDDYVVEKGSNYRKWFSGDLEQWGKGGLSNPITTVIGSGYRGSQQITYPITFLDDNVTVIASSANFTMSSVHSPNKSGFNLQLLSFDINRRSDYSQWYAIGKWK